MKNVLQPLAISVLISLGLTAAASVADTGIHKNVLGLGTTTRIIWNEEVEAIIKKVKSLEDSDLLIKVLAKQFKMKQKNKKVDFFVCY